MSEISSNQPKHCPVPLYRVTVYRTVTEAYAVDVEASNGDAAKTAAVEAVLNGAGNPLGKLDDEVYANRIGND